MDQIWWKESIIYQVYPRSFRDSNGDGIGDLLGLLSKLDYIADLGVNMIWLNPIYDSPNDDNGYDISDFYAIHPEYGTMDDFRSLLHAMHQRNIKLLMDVVINHTSDEHPWFLESRKGSPNPFSDFYIWRNGKNGGPPNNWPSFFGGSAWEYVQERDQYYLHLFSRKQPDLNWENPAVRKECAKVLRYWLDMGIDGFRMDVIPLLSKRTDFPDADLSNFGKVIEDVYSNGPRIHEFIREINTNVLSDYSITTVGEGPGITPALANLYVGKSRNELDMIFQLDHMALDHGPGGRFDPKTWHLQDLKRILTDWDQAIGEEGWISVFMDNHDFPRMVSRFGNDQEYRVESSKLLGMLILTLRGTPCIYFGSEIGMTNVDFSSIEDYRDVEILNCYRLWVEEGEMDDSTYLNLVSSQGRDNARTPMQWNSKEHAGFTTATPWIKVNPNYREINVEMDQASAQSIYRFYQKLINLRKSDPTFVYGKYFLVYGEHPTIYAYRRQLEDASYMMLLNFSDANTQIPVTLRNDDIVLSNYDQTNPAFLQPWEGRICRESAPENG